MFVTRVVWQQTQYRIKIMFSKKIPVSIIKSQGEKKRGKKTDSDFCPHGMKMPPFVRNSFK